MDEEWPKRGSVLVGGESGLLWMASVVSRVCCAFNYCFSQVVFSMIKSCTSSAS